MKQVARNITGFDGELEDAKYLIHDRDSSFCPAFDGILESSGVEVVKLPARSPNLNAFSERWILSAKNDCLDHFIPFTKRALEHILRNYVAHHNRERCHQGLDNTIPFPDEKLTGQNPRGRICRESRLSGLLNLYYREAS